MGKRGNGEGSIRRRVSKAGRVFYEVRATLPDGSRKSWYTDTKTEANRKLAIVLHEIEVGLLAISDESQTVESWLTHWLETKKPSMKPRAYARYEGLARTYLIPWFGSTRLTKLTHLQIESKYAKEREAGARETTLLHAQKILVSALYAAMRQGLVQRNVATLIEKPRPEHHEMQSLDLDQARTLLQAARGDRLEALYVLELNTGLRVGELLALKWEDVNLSTGVLQVRRELYFLPGGEWVLDAPKTAGSRRRLELDGRVLEALREHRKRQNEERLAAGAAWEDCGLIFTRPNGQPIRHTHLLERHFRPLLAKADLPPIRFHDLRHTAATLLLLKDMSPKIVAEMLGHTSTAITLDRYSHVKPGMQRRAAEVLADLLWGSENGQSGAGRGTGRGTAALPHRDDDE